MRPKTELACCSEASRPTARFPVREGENLLLNVDLSRDKKGDPFGMCLLTDSVEIKYLPIRSLLAGEEVQL